MMSAAYTELYTHLDWLQRETLYYQMLCKDLVYPHLMSSHRSKLKNKTSKFLFKIKHSKKTDTYTAILPRHLFSPIGKTF